MLNLYDYKAYDKNYQFGKSNLYFFGNLTEEEESELDKVEK